MSRNAKLSLLIGIVAFGTLLLFVVPISSSGSGGNDNNSSFVPFIPIWFAAIIPILVKKREENEREEKAKRNLTRGNRRQMMTELVERLNEDELRYLHRRLDEMSATATVQK